MIDWEFSFGAMFLKTRLIAFGIGIGSFEVKDDFMLLLETFISLKMSWSSVCSWTPPSLTFSGPVPLLPSFPSQSRLRSDHCLEYLEELRVTDLLTQSYPQISLCSPDYSSGWSHLSSLLFRPHILSQRSLGVSKYHL